MERRKTEDFLTAKGRRDLQLVEEIGARGWYDMMSGYVELPLGDNKKEKAVFDEMVRKFLDANWVVELAYEQDEYGDPTDKLIWWIRSDRDCY